MLREERLTYAIIKAWTFDCYFEGCRDHAVVKGWSHDQILAYVDYQFENSFERPVEEFMWRVVLLILSGAWSQDWYRSARKIITDNIVKNGIDNILAGVPTEEGELFRHDLRVLKLI